MCEQVIEYIYIIKHDGLIPRFEILKWNGESEEWIIRLTDDEWILEEVIGESLENALEMIENEI